MANALSTENFTQERKRYERAINVIERKQPDLTDAQVLEVLMARDALQHLLENGIVGTGEDIAQLHRLDDQLQYLGPMIVDNADFEKLQMTLNRPSDYWWWKFEPPANAWERFDWVWNVATIVALALAASFMYNIYSAFSTGSATVATAFSMIIQLAGLAAIGSGAITKQGHERLKKILNSLNIPSQFHAEITFVIALLLLAIAYTTNNYLDDRFFRYGETMYDDGRLTDAKEAYQQGLAVDSGQLGYHHKLGQVYESLGKLDLAFEQYVVGSQQGSATTLNDLGRVVINYIDPVSNESDPALAEAYLLLGLQRAETQLDTTPDLYYQLYRNTGWALIEQEKYSGAIQYLEQALEWRSKAGSEHFQEGGMGNCFLAYAYEKQGNEEAALGNWQKCVKYSRPSYIHEFRWLISIGKEEIAYCVNSEDVVAGYENERRPEAQTLCEKYLTEDDL